MVFLLYSTHGEAFALAILDLYCAGMEEKRGSATPNKKKLSLCRPEWKKQAIEQNLPTIRNKAAYTWLLENYATYTRYISRHTDILASDKKNRRANEERDSKEREGEKEENSGNEGKVTDSEGKNKAERSEEPI